MQGKSTTSLSLLRGYPLIHCCSWPEHLHIRVCSRRVVRHAAHQGLCCLKVMTRYQQREHTWKS
jgi:hypothetical protein